MKAAILYDCKVHVKTAILIFAEVRIECFHMIEKISVRSIRFGGPSKKSTICCVDLI